MSDQNDSINLRDNRKQWKQRHQRTESWERISHDAMSWESEQIDNMEYEAPSSSEYSFLFNSDSSSSTCLPSTEFNDWKTFSSSQEKQQQIVQSKWGGYALYSRLWDDSNAPITKINEREEVILNTEYCGILSDRLIGACSSFLTFSPENGRYIFSKCDLNTLKLTDISVLHCHRYLQYLDLSHNYLTDLKPLGGISYLIFLNASHNKIKEILNFTPPWYLTHVNLSYNDITLMNDLSEFWSIVRLDLSHNSIETINGLQNLRFFYQALYLRYLNLSYNLIEKVSNIDNLMNLQELNLEYNHITCFASVEPKSGINTLPNLRAVIMGYNKLSTLGFFRDAYGLRLIDLKYNKIADLLEVTNLKSHVYELDLRGNPCTKWPNYKDVLLYSMSSVRFVDDSEVSVSEKVSAATVFAPSDELLSARTISKLILLEQLNAPRIDASVIPYDEVGPPLVILSGPYAVKKVALGLQLVEKWPNRIKYCRSYTTREATEDVDDMKAYHFVKRNDFNEMTRGGEFLSIQELLGDSYGFHTNEIAELKTENKIGITQMDLNASIQMLSRYSNVKLVLVMTKDEEQHRQWIQDKFHVFTMIKDSVANLLAMKIGKNAAGIYSPESSNSRLDFITEIINQVVNSLDLPTYSMYVRPQGTGATATDIIQQSKAFSPKKIKTRGQLEVEEKKRITFRTEENETSKIFEDVEEESKPNISDLKVILDEDSNIIVDDEESKRNRKKARVLFRRDMFELGDDNFNYDELMDSTSSEQSFEKYEDEIMEPEDLKRKYIETVLKSRQIYIEQHQSKPGFYSLVIFTDDFEKAFSSLADFIHELHVNKPFCKPIFPPEIEYLHRYVIPDKVRTIAKELRENMSTAKMQRKTLLRTHGTTSWKEQMPSKTSQGIKEPISTIEEEFKKKLRAESLARKDRTLPKSC